MIYNFSSSNSQLTSSKDLPLTLIFLKNWILIKLINENNVKKFLHNLLTCNILKLNNNEFSFAAHCNPKGKVINNMYVFQFDIQTMALIERYSIYKKQLLEMKKYAIFSHINIIPDLDTILLGVAGINARSYLKNFFEILPNKNFTKINYKKTIILHFSFPKERFLLITTKKNYKKILKNSKLNTEVHNSAQWEILDVEAGYPIIEPINSEKFIPQEINLDTLKGISFNKGCYLGQEIIAKTQYKGINKHKLFCLIGKNCTYKPKPGDIVEINTKNNDWKNSGTVLQSYEEKNKKIWIQVVLKIPIVTNAKFKIKNKKSNDIFNLYIPKFL